jgi:hypothetical protein
MRDDNAHRYAREGHGDEHHRHRYDVATWDEIEPPEWIGRDRWPHPHEVTEELRDWWEAVGQCLGLGDDADADGAPGTSTGEGFVASLAFGHRSRAALWAISRQ